MILKKKLIFLALILVLIIPLVLAGNYGEGIYGSGEYNVDELPTTPTPDSPGGSSGGSSGGGASSLQFDIKILEIDFPLILGESFDFTYFVKSVGNLNQDVTIDFWIEQDDEIVTSGSDAIFLKSNEEKTETANLFLPTDLESGVYQFNIKVSFGNVKAEAHRTVELNIEEGVAEVEQLFDISFALEEILLSNSNELTAIVNFENFGAKPTEIVLKFIILDENQIEVYDEEETIVVETEEILRKNFKDLNLVTGRYTLVLETLYGENVTDEFKQEFEIQKGWGLYWAFGGILFALIIIILAIIIGKKKKRKNKDNKKSHAQYKKKVKEKLKNLKN